MKLAFCLFKYFPYGGLQRDFLQIARECVNRGHTVDVYTMRWEGDRDPEIGVQVIVPKGMQNHTRIASYVEQLQNYLSQENYDLVVGFNKMPGLDVYFAADTCYQAKAHTQRSWLYRLTPRFRRKVELEKAVFEPGAKTQILLLSETQRNEFIHFYHTPDKRLHLLPPGIDKSRIAPKNAAEIRAKTRAEWTIADNEFLLLMVGSGFKTKGVDRTLKAFAALPEELKNRCQLFVIGKDDAEPFERLAQRLDIERRVKFLGGRDDIPQMLLAADLLLHPAYNENTGTVLIEAMVSGLPVLTVDVCGYAHYVEEAKAGVVLSSPFNQKKFNKTVAEMLTSPERKQWQQNGLAFAKRDDIYNMHAYAADLIEAQLNISQPLNVVSLPKSTDKIFLSQELTHYFANEKNVFDTLMAIKGESFREQEGRHTQRIIIEGKPYFIKQHFGVGWKEIIKNLAQLRMPVLGAENEYLAIQRAHRLKVPTLEIAGYGVRGLQPSTRQSFLITHELQDVISLEDYTKNWPSEPPAFKHKQGIIKEVARMTRRLHENGVNHRDLYICHFLIKQPRAKEHHLPSFMPTIPSHAAAYQSSRPMIYLIDLHRAQLRAETPLRWIIKDLAALYFSSKDIGLTQRDYYRFIKEYRRKPLRDILNQEARFWEKVVKRGDRTYQEHHAQD